MTFYEKMRETTKYRNIFSNLNIYSVIFGCFISFQNQIDEYS